jgi:ABC-type bacteriocin/lantibiotic exporter with double-glycine peptidase domain
MTKIISFLGGYVYTAIYIIVAVVIIGLNVNIALKKHTIANLESEKQQLLTELSAAKAIKEVKAAAADKLITQEVAKYTDKIANIQEAKKDDNKTICDNAISLLRSSF